MSDVQKTQPTPMPTMAAIDTTGLDAAFNKEVNDIVSSIPMAPPVTASPYVVGHDATPNIHAPNIKPQVEMSRPMSGSAMDLKRARVHNNFASMQNLLRNYSNKKESEKFDNLKADITTVMKAQQQIDNAKGVLASDPNNAMAKSVLESNTKIIEAKLSNDKTRKEISKAFNISFTDPSENNTPEVKAMQAAQKEVKAATASGIDANTPAEKEVAQMHMNGGNPPAVQQAQATAAAGSKPKTTPVSYAQQFLTSSPATITPNPEYAAQLAAQQKREQQITQYVIPRLVQTYGQRNIALLKEGEANKRAEFKGAEDYAKSIAKLINDANIADAKDRTQLQMQGMRDKAAMDRTMLRVSAAMDAADAKGIKGTALAKKLQEHALQTWNDTIKKIDDDDVQISALLTANKDKNGQPLDDKRKADLQHRLDMNMLTRRQAGDERQKLLTKIYGTPSAGANDEVVSGTTKGYINGTGTSNSSDSSKSDSTEQAGRLLSDSSNDEDDNAKEDDAVDKFYSIFDN